LAGILDRPDTRITYTARAESSAARDIGITAETPRSLPLTKWEVIGAGKFGRFHALKASGVLIDEAARAILARRRALLEDDVVIAVQVREEHAAPIIAPTDRGIDAPPFGFAVYETAGSHGDLFSCAFDAVARIVAVQLRTQT
jgi:hypothetical protein